MEEIYSITSWIKACVVGFQMEGWDTELIIQKAGLSQETLNAGYCSIEVYNAIFEAAEALYGQSAGVVARRGVLPNTFHSFSLAMMSASSIYEGLCLLTKHNNSITNAIEFFVTDREQAIFGFKVCRGVHLEPAVAIAILASILKTARFILPGSACIKRAEMTHDKPIQDEIYQAYFKVPIDWGQNRYALHYDSHIFDTPSMHANPSLMLKGEQNWIEEVASFEEVSFLLRVRSFIKANLANSQLVIEYVARNFGMSIRTFQRRLGSEGTSFKLLLDHIRKEEAISLIRKTNAMTSEVADSLGFADVGNFSRAFKRWFGKSPDQFRKGRNIHPQ